MPPSLLERRAAERRHGREERLRRNAGRSVEELVRSINENEAESAAITGRAPPPPVTEADFFNPRRFQFGEQLPGPPFVPRLGVTPIMPPARTSPPRRRPPPPPIGSSAHRTRDASGMNASRSYATRSSVRFRRRFQEEA